MPETRPIQEIEWELIWSPYDDATYRDVLAHILPGDIVVDIGSGDFRLAKRMAAIARWVYGIEILNAIFPQEILAENLTTIHADALVYPFPEDVTVGVLLMRHCRHFRLYAEKLRAAGARRLITNARWRMGVEEVDLCQVRVPYEAVDMGWFACWCGNTGFKAGPASQITPETDRMIHEVIDCPQCQSTGE